MLLGSAARRALYLILLVMLSAAVAGGQSVLVENFDEVTAPALPAGWVATNASGQNPLWATASTYAYTTPNSAFVSAGGPSVDERLESPSIAIATSSAELRFQHAYAFGVDPGALTESIPVGFGTLEISIAGSAFQGIVTAGGSFVMGGPGGSSSTWISQSGFPPVCCNAVIVNLPAAAAGTNIVLRWRLTTSMGPNIPGSGEWGIDAVQICDGGPCSPLPQPVKTDVDTAGNGIWEPGETVDIDPSYFNDLNAPFDLSGTATSLTGPAGATYTINDSVATYGSIDPGTSRGCSLIPDCYSVTVDDPATRPADHWDAQLTEDLSTGFSLTRTLHVGSSFTDAPPSHPFYAFIENIFHNGITGGCGAASYCPEDPITRAQMAVFLLKSRHGNGYVPPACSATVFADVPCPGGSNVDWINQLAAEFITGGCGGGNYCPGNPVTRGQMAVFLLRAQYHGFYVPPQCSATIFADVVCPGAQFVDYINQLVAQGITAGCGGGMYCPASPNTRGQMAVFLVKAFGFLLYSP